MVKRILEYASEFFRGKKTMGCEYAYYSLYFDWQNKIRVCPKKDKGIIIENYDGIWLDTNKLIKEKTNYLNKFKNQKRDEECEKCEYYKEGIYKEGKEIKEIHLGHWKSCYLRCKYCHSEKNWDFIEAKHYNIFNTISQLIDEKIITKETKVIFECGDALLHPEFDKLLYFLINNEIKKIIINTPAMTYRESIADGIAKNAIKLIVNIDCANKQIYKYIKGEKTYETTLGNLKRYLQYQEPKEKRVITKYTLYKGGNDGKKEISDWFVLSRDIGINEIYIDIDENWYEEISKEIPEYLSDILKFIKNISNLNGIEIRYSEKVKEIYKRIKK